MNDQALIDEYHAHRAEIQAERDWYEQRFVQTMDEDGKGWSFGQENLQTLALHHVMQWSQGDQVSEPTPAMIKVVGKFLSELFESSNPRSVITAHKNVLRARYRNKPPKPENLKMFLAVAFFERRGCSPDKAITLTIRALDMGEWARPRIKKAYQDNQGKGLDEVDAMLEAAKK